MPYELQLVDQHKVKEVFPITGNAMILGRATGDILIEDSEVSSRHCTIFLSGGVLHLQDYGSRNGTYVNGKRVEKMKLQDGDLIRLGSVEFRVATSQAEELEFLDPMSIVENWKQTLEHSNRKIFADDNITELVGREWEQCLRDVQLKMTIESKDGRLVNHLVPDSELTVGRSGMVPLLAEDDEASRRHARFFVDSRGKVCVEDLGSANGTFVNEEKLSAARELVPTDIVRLGKTRMQVFLFLPEFSG